MTDIVHLCSMHMILNINDHWSICSFVFINVHFCSNLIIYVHFCSICSFWWCYNIFVLLEVSWKWTNWTKVICSFLCSFRLFRSFFCSLYKMNIGHSLFWINSGKIFLNKWTKMNINEHIWTNWPMIIFVHYDVHWT